MRITIVSPVPVESAQGNGVTARRWQWLLADLGHEVRIRRVAGASGPHGGRIDADLLIALHARKSAAAIKRFARDSPGRPIVLGMTGTDLYEDLPESAIALRSIELADQIVVLQPTAIRRLPEPAREKAVVIYQSVTARPAAPREGGAGFGICVLAHLRAVKDPLLAARAVARLPQDSTVHVTLAGAAIDDDLGDLARIEHADNPRFSWLGELSKRDAEALLRRSRALVISSRSEGGANVVCEAIVAGVPILATAIDGNTGLLGGDYPGYFPVGDAAALADLMLRTATEPAFRRSLQRAVVELQPRFDPSRERDAWRDLLLEIA